MNKTFFRKKTKFPEGEGEVCDQLLGEGLVLVADVSARRVMDQFFNGAFFQSLKNPLQQGGEDQRGLFFQSLKNAIDCQPVLWHTKSQDEPDFKFVHPTIAPCGLLDATTEDNPILSPDSTPLGGIIT